MYLTGENLSEFETVGGYWGFSHPASSCLRSYNLYRYRTWNRMEGKWFHVLAGPQWWAFDLFHLCALIQCGDILFSLLATIRVLEVFQDQPGLHFLYPFIICPASEKLLPLPSLYNQNASASHQIGFAP